MDKQNSEFIRLFHKSGWTQARAADELGLTTGAISQFVGGTVRPKSTVIRLFKILLSDSRPFENRRPEPPLLPLENGELQLIKDLRKVQKNIRHELADGLVLIARAMRPKGRP
jgi:transcriptional regulator with XRE-family HTH domain